MPQKYILLPSENGNFQNIFNRWHYRLIREINAKRIKAEQMEAITYIEGSPPESNEEKGASDRKKRKI